MEIKKYQLQRIKSINSANRIIKEVKKIDIIFNATFDKSTRILIVEVNPPTQSFKIEDFYHKLELRILKAVHICEKHATMVSIDNKEVFRKTLYLRGLDCAFCGTRIENLAKKEFNHERIVVDYPTYRFIIETTDKDLIEHLEERVTEVAHKVDERIIVQSVEKERPTNVVIKDSMKKPTFVIICIGILIFIWGAIYAYDTLEDFLNERDITDVVAVTFILIGYLLIGHKIIIRFVKNLFKGNLLDENFLMTVASIGALITRHYLEAVLVISLYQLGELLQNLAVNKSRKSIAALLQYDVQTVKLKLNDDITEVGVEGILVDDVIVVNKGDMIPLDGIICKGKTILDMKNITGESALREVDTGEEVISGSINMDQSIDVRVTRTYNNSMITRILDLVENATINKAKSENFISRFAKYYTPIVVILAAVVLLVGIILSFITKAWDWTDVVYIAMEFLVISCPCALVISIPLCYFCAIGVASKRGILIRGSNYLEAVANTQNVVFDKTGTLTKGTFTIREIHPIDGYTEDDIKRFFIYAEYYSEHPIGKSIVDEYGRNNIYTEIIDGYQPLKGGVQALVNGLDIKVCNEKLASNLHLEFPHIASDNLIIYVFKEKVFIGYLVIGDIVRPEAKKAIEGLKENVGAERIYMLTGDSKTIADSIGKELNIDEVYSDLLPNEKVEIMEKIKIDTKNGKTMYIGDGINDAPVIANSDVGIAIGDTASDATISIADVVIMTSDLNKINELGVIARKTKNKVIHNIIFILGVKVFIVLLAFLLLFTPFNLPLGFAIFADVGVSMISIINSLFIFRLYKRRRLFFIKENK